MAHCQSDMISFSSIELSDPYIHKNQVRTDIVLNKNNGDATDFQLLLKYENTIDEKYLPFLRLAFTMPIMNYGLFTNKIILRFPISISDYNLLKTLNKVFSRDIFVNKILRRRTDYILPEFLPDEQYITPKDAEPKASITASNIYPDQKISDSTDCKRCGILSSGGKESLLTYGILKEIGCQTYPFYVNESGGHWRTAIPAYRYHMVSDDNTQRVWTNVDRFYVFMLDNLHFIRPDHRKVWADTYPIRLCIFPFYVFLLLPLFAKEKIGNLLLGSEFDDLRITPEYLSIPHYFGIYDQHQDYDSIMNQWYQQRFQGLIQWSALRSISGLIVERILVKKYPNLAKNQRSCHSCHFENNEIIPCSHCSKCMGVLLFLHANKADPRIMKFKDSDLNLFKQKVNPDELRLDEDEKHYSFYLMDQHTIKETSIDSIDHIEKIHINKGTCDIDLIPLHLRHRLFNIIQHYTNGCCTLQNGVWVSIEEKDIF